MDDLENLAQAMEENAAVLRKLLLLPEKTYEEIHLLTHEITHILNMNEERKKAAQANLPLTTDLQLIATDHDEESENWHAQEDMSGDRD